MSKVEDFSKKTEVQPERNLKQNVVNGSVLDKSISWFDLRSFIARLSNKS